MNTKRFFITILIFTLALAACGGRNNEANIAPPADTNTTNDTGNRTDNTIAENNPVEADVINTEESTPAPATDLGACQNKYYPIQEDVVYTYQNSTDFETIIQKHSYTNITPDGFTSILDIGDIYSEMHWDCSGEGMVSADYAQFDLFPGMDVSVVTIDSSGIIIPAEENMVIGYEWDSSFTMQVTLNMEGTSIVVDVTINQHLEIVGEEAVSVPAGDYPKALLVHMTLNTNMLMAGTETASSSTGTAYYVEGVGLVKQTSTFEGYSSSMELLSVE